MSSKRWPISCTPIGSPSRDQPQFTDAAGCSLMFQGTVKAMCGSALRGSLLGLGSSAAYGRIGDTGVIRKS